MNIKIINCFSIKNYLCLGIIPAVRLLRQEDSKFSTHLAYRANSWLAWATQWDHLSDTQELEQCRSRRMLA